MKTSTDEEDNTNFFAKFVNPKFWRAAFGALYKSRAREPTNCRLRRLSLRLCQCPAAAAPFFLASVASLFAPAAFSPAAAMAPRPRSISGYHGVRPRPSGMFYAEIRSGNMRLGLGTFETAHEAARAYDAAAWRLRRPRAQMNFRMFSRASKCRM
ncbi:putative AP2 protein [Hordeum vulgare]|nr:putative AP2 protein [Hordeum vulgare]